MRIKTSLFLFVFCAFPLLSMAQLNSIESFAALDRQDPTQGRDQFEQFHGPHSGAHDLTRVPAEFVFDQQWNGEFGPFAEDSSGNPCSVSAGNEVTARIEEGSGNVISISSVQDLVGDITSECNFIK